MSALLAGGLLRPDGGGAFRPTTLVREYAFASVVAPLERTRARALVERAKKVASRINSAWPQNAYAIDRIAVSGAYMSRRKRLEELSLWLVLSDRPDSKHRKSPTSIGEDSASREIEGAFKALSSFIIVHLVTDTQCVDRPFCVVFEATDRRTGSPLHAWAMMCAWSASIRHQLLSK
jgi:hypothetical protein